MSPEAFIPGDGPQVHFVRRKEILRAHPEVLDLAGPNRWTVLAVVGLVAAQIALAALQTTWPWWASLLLAYVIGATIAHALYVMIHEATHNLVARSATANRLIGIFCDVALGFPGAIAFRKYHLLHHRFLGEPELDADVAPAWEARLVGHAWWRKAVWMTFFSISQALRPRKIRSVPLIDGWTLANAAVVATTDAVLVFFFGPFALAYVVVSMLFGLGLHPLGGRWIQEHYVTTPGQETYSYYGAANLLAFNVGYHNEHHDFMNVAWNRLPRIKARASEFYDPLASYRSWTAVLLRFVLDPRMSPYSRVIHPSTDGARAPSRA